MSLLLRTHPRRVAGVEGQPFGEDFVLLDASGRSLRGLNESAACIWALCDGTQSLEEIATHLVQKFEVGKDAALGDTLNFVELLERYGLVELLPPESAGPRKEARR